LQVVHPIGNGDAVSIGAEIVIVDQNRIAIPLDTGILEYPDEFLLLGIDADDRLQFCRAALTQFRDAGELSVSVRVRTSGELLVVDTKRETHLLEQSRDLSGADPDPKGL
jgi:hypothetical protein